MNRSILPGLPIVLGSIFASGMGIFWAVTRLSLLTANQQAPDPGAYIVTGIVGAAVLLSFRSQERRIQELERELLARGSNTEPRAAP